MSVVCGDCGWKGDDEQVEWDEDRAGVELDDDLGEMTAVCPDCGSAAIEPGEAAH